ncbi:tetratricopeptide repeat protein [Hymenobacter sp. BT188]|uniref:tetratricopeptide repeat protein n=1 Tax=Hymenobacter sp. BT188 TaxID=2763504 RepID=UPI001650DB70|nr:tetratricopeptide repeat protein [Hymenobacter sp. BT188]MBC6608537.1 tetratricopeptide repeat protein [Hymenobacter sp. BT188]
MNFKPWKLSFLVALSVSGSTAFAQSAQTAQKSLELERYSEARAALLRQGQSPEAMYELGRLYQMREMPDSAAFYFSKITPNADSPMSLVAAGRAALAKGNEAEAANQFDKAVKATKKKEAFNTLKMIAQAYAESDVKDTAKAIAYVNAAQAANKGKDDLGLMIARGDIYQKSENGGGEAMGSYDRALIVDPNSVMANYRKGQLYVRSRNFNEARTSFEKAISLDPNFAPAYRDLAEMYYFAKQYDLALSTFQKYMSIAEKTPSTNAKYASFLYLTGKYPEALTEIQNVLKTDPNNLTMNRLLAYSLYENKQNDLALPAMEKYMKMAPANKIIPEDNVYYGKMLMGAGRTDEGVAIIEKAIQANPDKAGDLQNDLAQAYIAKKDYAKAIATYQAKIAAQGDKPELADQIYLARAYEQNKQFAEADKLYSAVATARPTYVPVYLMRARANFGLDPDSKQGTAKPHYEKFIEVAKANDPTKYKEGLVEANKYLGYYYYQKGEKATSLPYWKEVIALDPNDTQASTAITEITKRKK